MDLRMAYLGPRGTFCEEAAAQYTREVSLVPYPSIESVFAAVHNGEVQSGVVPIENSCEGAVNQTLDLLTNEYNIKIAGDIILPVNHNLLVRPDVNISDVNCILSHHQALAQCREYISRSFPGITLYEVASTAEAARQVAQSAEPWAAIGTGTAARAYGLAIEKADINDYPNNKTRFVVLSRQDSVYKDNCKTSLLLYVVDQPGSLFHVLKEFYIRGINLTKIESRPTRTEIGNYLFFIDIEGHRSEAHIQDALESLSALTLGIRILGSYPAAIYET